MKPQKVFVTAYLIVKVGLKICGINYFLIPFVE